jgi:hypothetical protein
MRQYLQRQNYVNGLVLHYGLHQVPKKERWALAHRENITDTSY